MPGVSQLRHEDVREALRLLGEADPPHHRGAAQRRLRDHLRAPGAVRSALERAPSGAREAFVTLAQQGAATVEDLLGRGWWGRGALPPPLDWLQRRGLVLTGEDGLVHVADEARDGFHGLVPAIGAEPEAGGADTRVMAARAVVVADDPAELDRAIGVPAAELRAIAPTVAISGQPPATVERALRTAGMALADDLSVTASPAEPALPIGPEEAVGPRSIRALLRRAVTEERQVRLEYFASSRGGTASERVVCPWTFDDDLLVGYCHLRAGERTFALDRIGRARLLPGAVEHPPPARPG